MTGRRKPGGEQEHHLPSLLIPRVEAEQRLRGRIEKGVALRSVPIQTHEQLKEEEKQYEQWTAYNHELLLRMFDSPDIVREYSSVYGMTAYVGVSLQQEIEAYRKWTDERVSRLESILGRLGLIPEAVSVVESAWDQAKQLPTIPLSRRVFVVHGHDEAAKAAVARLLEQLELEPVILHEQPNAGRTIIEKFEDSADVGYAVVLLTPDDVGAPADHQKSLSRRARQNVVFELGFFFGRLGRGRVCALYREGLELPSDILGILYVPFDAGGGWQLSLAKEISASGITVDLNTLLP